MPTFINPAATLTANRIPFATGDGRLADGGLEHSAGNVLLGGAGNLTPATLSRFAMVNTGATASMPGYALSVGDGYKNFRGAMGLSAGSAEERFFWDFAYSTAFAPGYEWRYAGGALATLRHVGTLHLGDATQRSNGLVQVAVHTTPGGGYGFYDFSLYRSGANAARTGASFQADGGFIGSGASLTSLPAGQLTGALPAISGAALTALNGSQVTSGTVADARLSANVPLLNAATNVFTGDIQLGTGGAHTWLRDANGDRVIRERSTTNPVTLADVITVLKWHGLCV